MKFFTGTILVDFLKNALILMYKFISIMFHYIYIYAYCNVFLSVEFKTTVFER